MKFKLHLTNVHQCPVNFVRPLLYKTLKTNLTAAVFKLTRGSRLLTNSVYLQSSQRRKLLKPTSKAGSLNCHANGSKCTTAEGVPLPGSLVQLKIKWAVTNIVYESINITRPHNWYIENVTFQLVIVLSRKRLTERNRPCTVSMTATCRWSGLVVRAMR